MRVSVEFRTASKEQYKDFCTKYPDIKLSFQEWKAIIYGFNYGCRDCALKTGEKVKLTHGFGQIAVNKKKMIKVATIDGIERIILPVDWKKTKEKGKYIYHFNHHTEGYRCKWKWFRENARFEFAGIWNFKPARDSSRKINEYLTNPTKSYLDIYREWELK